MCAVFVEKAHITNVTEYERFEGGEIKVLGKGAELPDDAGLLKLCAV